MKVIKVGQSAQSRIAQACDRCRSKKIRCDGVRPTCTQCASVGFECRTSDKLSRRAFPRGYTESLEERVRALETEVSELKDLLDEKDEKIDMLSKMHGNRRRLSNTSHSSVPGLTPDRALPLPLKEDTFRVQASPLLLGVENSDSYLMGHSSGRAFIELFKRKVAETGKTCSDFNPEAFLHIQGTQPLLVDTEECPSGAPPRLFSDRCVNVFFQEWAPLFPILHKPTFLRLYEEFVADPTKIKNDYKTAQLYLVFSIAGLSDSMPDLAQVAACEKEWTQALDLLSMENTMNALQCLILALLYCIMRADYKRIQHYKGIAVSLSHRLGLHQSQKRYSFGALTIETRKKVFWTLYTLDCFTAATLGLPKLLRDDDIQAEYPTDADDEYVTEKGFQPSLPGESTRISSALALFRAARILARVLEKNYSASPSHELSLQQMEAMDVDLEMWYDELPSHLRLNFVQDKPSTDVTGSRSPLLALAYYFIRILIYRPAVGSTLGHHKAAPALLAISNASKHIVQIVQLLEERNMIFSFCLNKHDLLLVCGMTLLYQAIDLKRDSKLIRDNERLVNGVLKIVDKEKAPGSWDLRRIASRLVNVEPSDTAMPPPTRGSPATTTSSRKTSPALTQGRRKSSSSQSPATQTTDAAAPPPPPASATENDLLQQQQRMRRMTMPQLEESRPKFRRSPSRQSFDSVTPNTSQRDSSYPPAVKRASSRAHTNLDYLSLSDTPSQSRQPSPPGHTMLPPPPSSHSKSHHHLSGAGLKAATPVNAADWEVLLGSLDGGLNNVYDAIYGGRGFPAADAVPPQHSVAATATTATDWSPDAWDLSTFSIQGDFAAPPQSLSGDSLSSSEGIAPSELGLSSGDAGGPVDVCGGNMLPATTGKDEFAFDALDGYLFGFPLTTSF